ncbi:helix-turn-helix domain-containing protein [Streptomyces sp. NPDC048211]|uniref:helix-turn-helix domain-containing protein n=1 Tax=Streptomyces sp. NPDC048211 TaxID=3365516 RepID=UPI003718F470
MRPAVRGLAARADIKRRTLQRIERGGDPRYSHLIRKADALGTTLVDLVRE